MAGNVGKYDANPDETVWCFTNCDPTLSLCGGVVVKSLEIFLKAVETSLKSYKDQRKCPTILTRMKKVLSTIKNIITDPEKNQRVIKDEQTGETYPLFMTWMGIWCASKAVGFYIKEIGEYKKVYEDVDPLHASLWGLAIEYFQQIQNTFGAELEGDPMAALNTASPKMRRLLELLRGYQPVGGQESTLCGIIYVNQRCVAKVLCDWLMELKRLQPEYYGHLKMGWVVGHSARPGIEAKIASNSDAAQKEVIKKFRENEFNLLVATSVLEEGLDVRTCNLVVRFDRLNTFRQYLQSKGRARAESAYFYMMTASEDSHHIYMQLNNFRQMEEMVKNLNSKQKSESLTDKEEDKECEDPDLYFKNGKTGAKITSRSAISLLYKYCQRLPSDSFTQLEPIFSIEEQRLGTITVFGGVVVLPVNCPLEKRSIKGPMKRDRDIAKKAVAVLAYKQLHEFGELDDHLLPVNKEAVIREYVQKLKLRIETLDNDQKQRLCPTKQKVGTRSRKDKIVKQVAQLFTNNNHMKSDHYLYGISLQFPEKDSLPSNCLTFGVITGNPIDIKSLFSVYLKTIWNEVVDSPESSEVRVEFLLIEKLTINGEQKESFEKFHCFIIEEILRFSTDDLIFDTNSTEFKLLFVPLMNGRAIDWTFINKMNSFGDIKIRKLSSVERERYQFNKQTFNDCIFYPWYKERDERGRPIVYYAKRVTDLSSRSKWTHNNDYKTFDEYFANHKRIDIKKKGLPLIEGRALNKSHKGLFKGAQLKPYSTGKKDKSFTEYYPPELVYIHPFPASLWQQALCLPSIVYRLNQLYLAEELRLKINSETIPTIGSSDVTDNCLSIGSKSADSLNSTNDSLKRLSDTLDSDDECEGHDFTNDKEQVCRIGISPFKKPRKKSPIKIEKSESVVTVPKPVLTPTLNNVNSGVSGASSQLLMYTKAIIVNFKEMVERHISGKNNEQAFKLTTDQILKELNSVQINKFPDLRYGEAFPFIFKGDIGQHIKEKFDGRVGDRIPGPSAALILEALTMVGANDSFNLERLEVIGDSFLKLVTSGFVYFSCPELDEGRLSYLRQIQICNCNLYYIGCEKQIHKLLVSHKWFPNNNWLLPSYHISNEDDLKILERQLSKKNTDNKRSDSFKHRIINNKSIADSIKALIGAHLLIGGNKSALIFMEWLGLKVVPYGEPPIDYLNENGLKSDELFRWLPLPKEPINQALNLSETQINEFIRKHFFGANLKVFEEIIDYEFKNKAYLIQALTHSSYHFNEFTDCYQKLEFLGDAIIDYLISRHIFATPNKKFNPGQLTDLRSALVNNSFFAAIVVKYKFHKFLKNLSPDLFRAIQNFEQNFNGEEIDSVIKSFDKLTEDECTDIKAVEVPRALSDIFKSVAGAIFLDSDLSFDVVWKVYYKLLKPEIDYFTEHIPKMPVKLILEICNSVSNELVAYDSGKTGSEPLMNMHSRQRMSSSQQKLHSEDHRSIQRDSFSRFGEDLTEYILKYLPFDKKFCLECVCKDFQKFIFNKVDSISIINHYKLSKNIIKFNNRKIININALESALTKCVNTRRILNIENAVNIEEVFMTIIKCCNRLKEVESDFKGISKKTLVDFCAEFGCDIKKIRFTQNLPLIMFRFCPYIESIGNDWINLKDIFEYDEIFIDQLKSISIYYSAEDMNRITKLVERNKNTFRSLEIIVHDKTLTNLQMNHLFKELLKLTRLRKLGIYYYINTDSTFIKFMETLNQHLGELTMIDFELKIKNTSDILQVYKSLNSLSKLVNIQLSNNRRSSEPLISIKSQDLNNLKDLKLIKISGDTFVFKEEFFNSIEKYFLNLSSLNITNADINSKCLINMSKMREMRELRITSTSSSSLIDENDIHEFILNCPKLQQIYVSNTRFSCDFDRSEIILIKYTDDFFHIKTHENYIN